MISDLQKASMWKRASAFLLDAILLVVLATGFFLVISLITGYDQHMNIVSEAYERIGTQYGITSEMKQKDQADMTPEELAAMNAANAAIAADAEAVHSYQMVSTLSVLIVSLGLLASFLLLEFAVPLLLGDGQTIGKKIFGIGLMHTEGVRLGHVALFIRTVLGKYAVETMPLALSLVFIIGGIGSPVFLLITAVLLIAQVILLIVSRENALLHDRMAVTVAVDLASQMIFDTHEQLLEYKKKAHAEKAASSVY
ncbi:MAG: RDD family protein [Clostridia bacterium]|nr:RDD family protein [Clostridia bacterium]